MNQTASILLETTDSRATEIGFGECDGKGRELGIKVFTSTLFVGPGPRVHKAYAHDGRPSEYNYNDETHTYYAMNAVLTQAPGVYYTATCQTTRAGKCFGASQGRDVFGNEAERDAWVAKRVAGARKRAPKAATSGRSGRREAK